MMSSMKLQDIEQQALGLSESDRAELVLSLMRTLVAPAADVTDEEVLKRDAELEAGSVEPMLHEEFVRRIREERSRKGWLTILLSRATSPGYCDTTTGSRHDWGMNSGGS